SLVKDQSRPGTTLTLLIQLNKAGILTPENRDRIKEIHEHDAREEKINLFSKAGMLTQDTFNAIYDRRQNEIMPIENILLELVRAGGSAFATKENYETIKDIHIADRYFIVRLLNELNKANVLNSDTRSFAREHASRGLGFFYSFVAMINNAFLFNNNDPSANILEALRHVAILNSQEFHVMISRVPGHLINQILFDNIFVICNNGALTAAQKMTSLNNYINQLIPHNENQVPEVRPINDSQSIHTASVHNSVAASLTRLKKRYHGIDVEETYKLIEEFSEKLVPEKFSDPNNKTEWVVAARETLTKVLPNMFYALEAQTKTPMKEILALIWMGVHDRENNSDSLEVALEKFIEHLYYIGRGYNLDKNDKDNGEKSVSICTGGAINQIVASLHLSHKDVEIIFISNETVNSKFDALTKLLIIKYVNSAHPLELRQKLKQSMVEENRVNNTLAIPEIVINYLKNETEFLSELENELFSAFYACDIFLMSSLNSKYSYEACNKSNRSNLYLYQDPHDKKGAFYYIENDEKKYYLNDENNQSVEILQNKFNSKQCIDKNLIESVLEITSNRNHTLFNGLVQNRLLNELCAAWEEVRLTERTVDEIKEVKIEKNTEQNNIIDNIIITNVSTDDVGKAENKIEIESNNDNNEEDRNVILDTTDIEEQSNDDHKAEEMIEKMIAGIDAYLDIRDSHLGFFSRFFGDETRGKNRADIYKSILEDVSLPTWAKEIAAYSLLASFDGKTLQKTIVKKLNGQEEKVFSKRDFRLVLKEKISNSSQHNYSVATLDKVVANLVKYANSGEYLDESKIKEILNVKGYKLNRARKK
ncbi:MAG: hypothetical protein JO149_05360, partial [Gammaproteobacteria bacterium]|nr:hypothetical protein [Gammaproteobacteria bacterium]